MFLTLQDPISCSLLDSSVHGILQTIIPEWVPFPSPGDIPIQRSNLHFLHLLDKWIPYHWTTREGLYGVSGSYFSSTATSWLDIQYNEKDSFPGHCYQFGFVLHCQKCLIPKAFVGNYQWHLFNTVDDWGCDVSYSVVSNCLQPLGL